MEKLEKLAFKLVQINAYYNQNWVLIYLQKCSWNWSFHLKKKKSIIFTHIMIFLLLPKIYPCNLRLVLCSRNTFAWSGHQWKFMISYLQHVWSLLKLMLLIKWTTQKQQNISCMNSLCESSLEFYHTWWFLTVYTFSKKLRNYLHTYVL